MTDFTPFRDNLHDHRMPVREELWTRIEAELPPRPGRRLAPWFWMTLLAGAVLGGGLVYLAISWPATKTPPLPAEPLARVTPAADAQAGTTVTLHSSTATDPSQATAGT